MKWTRSRLGLLAAVTCITGVFACDFNFEYRQRECGANSCNDPSDAGLDTDAPDPFVVGADAANSADSGSTDGDISFENLVWLIPVLWSL